MKNKKFVIANWKMNGSTALCADFAADFGCVPNYDGLEIIVAPPFIYIANLFVQWRSISDNLSVAGQDCHFEKKGAYTGDISARMLADVGCKYVIVGHSERRSCYGETSDLICKKAEVAIECGLIPIICVGDKADCTKKDELVLQCRSSVPKNASSFIIAYEPINSIGTGLVSTSTQIESAVKIIKTEIGPDIPIIYGGSVTEENCKNLTKTGAISGLLVGGASLSATRFLQICKNVAAI